MASNKTSNFGEDVTIKFPNRRSARNMSPQWQNEISDIRRDLQSMGEELKHELEQEGAHTQLEEEVTALYRELQRATSTLEQERSTRKRVEAELEHVRSQRLRETADVSSELDRKRIELATLREERATMKEWLDRGVAECRRVAEDVAGLKQELEESERTIAIFTKDKQRLAGNIQQLSDELASSQLTLEKSHHDKSVLELKAEEANTLYRRAEDQRKAAISDCDRLSSEIVRLTQRVRGLEDAELSMQSMCACIQQLAEEMDVLERSVASGDFEAPVRPPIVDSASEISVAKPLNELITDAKHLLHILQDASAKLRVTVKRCVADKMRVHSELHSSHEQAMHQLQRERDSNMQQLVNERETLRRRVNDLEREIVSVAEGVHRDISQEANERLGALDRLVANNTELTKTNDELRLENDRLRAKARKMKLDWSKVDESRRRFQQLQAEVGMMKQYTEALQQENRNLKLLATHQLNTPQSVLNASGHSSGAEKSVLSHHADPLDVHTYSQVQRQAFQDWKAGQTSGRQ